MECYELRLVDDGCKGQLEELKHDNAVKESCKLHECELTEVEDGSA